MSKNKINSMFQASIFDSEPSQREASGKNTPVKKTSNRKQTDNEPATTLMKTVAEKAFMENKARKTFTPAEIDEILDKKSFGEDLTKQERTALRIQYKKMKSWVKEKEAGNKSQIIAIPSLTDGSDEFYKVFDFSALYYVYRLADRMGRNATLRIDRDERPKMLYQASIKDIEKFVEQFQELENPSVERTLEGVYIFTLKQPLTDEELIQLRAIEEERRDRLRGIIKPKAMDPTVFQSLLMIVRQVAPKVRKLERHNYYLVGEDMLKNIYLMLAYYYDYAQGLLSKEECAANILHNINELFAALTVLSETKTWDAPESLTVGVNINAVREIVEKNLGVKTER